jgi:hypothetical protein
MVHQEGALVTELAQHGSSHADGMGIRAVFFSSLISRVTLSWFQDTTNEVVGILPGAGYDYHELLQSEANIALVVHVLC